MGTWINQAREIKRLRQEIQRQQSVIAALRQRLGEDASDIDVNDYGVVEAERALIADGRPVAAMKAYRERTGADLVTAKKAIDSVS